MAPRVPSGARALRGAAALQHERAVCRPGRAPEPCTTEAPLRIEASRSPSPKEALRPRPARLRLAALERELVADVAARAGPVDAERDGLAGGLGRGLGRGL